MVTTYAAYSLFPSPIFYIFNELHCNFICFHLCTQTFLCLWKLFLLPLLGLVDVSRVKSIGWKATKVFLDLWK